jgi:hypothetical protein
MCEPPEDLDDLSSAQLRELVVMFITKLSAFEQLVAQQRAEIARLKGPEGAARHQTERHGQGHRTGEA